MTRRFRRKQTEVEAEQFTGKHPHPEGVCTCGLMVLNIPGGCQPHVHTIHGGQRVDLKPGDWIIPESDGEHYYPVDADVFAAMYEEVEA